MKKICAFLAVVLLGAGIAEAGEWKSLFDGKTTAGWRGFRKTGFPSRCWVVEDGSLKRLQGARKEDCGDLVTLDQYENFEFELEWRISPGGNSGIKYLVREDRPASWERAYMEFQIEEYRSEKPRDYEKRIAALKPEQWADAPMGFEMQLIDDKRNADALKGSQRITGALYDILAPDKSSTRPAGEFNKARIVVQGNHIEHWINDVKVLAFERGSKQLSDAIAVSKFKGMEGFGRNRRGYIDLQDHSSSVWFRNIRIRELPGY